MSTAVRVGDPAAARPAGETGATCVVPTTPGTSPPIAAAAARAAAANSAAVW
jgi:hypothetical protein